MSRPEPDSLEPGQETDQPDQGAGGKNGSNQQGSGPSDGDVQISPAPSRAKIRCCRAGRDDGAAGQRNRAPVVNGPIQLGDVAGCALLTIALSDLLRGVSDPDGDVLAVRDVRASSGTVTADGSGWVFDADAPGPVTITYAVTDSEFLVAHTAHLTVLERTVIGGTDGADIILGTPCADDIAAGKGDDNVDARGGDDLVDAGDGSDHVIAGTGADTVLGGSGDDVVFAGAGADIVWCGAGDDRAFGEAGNDLLFGEAGNDLLDGGEGRDILDGGEGNDRLVGGEGDDRLYGASGADDLSGGTGADVLVGGAGDDQLQGGDGGDVLSDGAGRDLVSGEAGDDVIILALDGAEDTIDGGAGLDTLDLSAATIDLIVDLRNETVSAQELGLDRIASVEVIIAGSGDDRFDVGDRDLVLTGGGGSDVYAFAAQAEPRDVTHVVQITDFSVGDYIDLVRYALFEGEASGGRPLRRRSKARAMPRPESSLGSIIPKDGIAQSSRPTSTRTNPTRSPSFSTASTCSVSRSGRCKSRRHPTPDIEAGGELCEHLPIRPSTPRSGPPRNPGRTSRSRSAPASPRASSSAWPWSAVLAAGPPRPISAAPSSPPGPSPSISGPSPCSTATEAWSVRSWCATGSRSRPIRCSSGSMTRRPARNSPS